MADQQPNEHESWQTGLLCAGYVAFFVVSVWLYYRTSETYYLRKHMETAGYVVPGWSEYCEYCCSCCWGPLNRRSWEREHRFFRHAYPASNNTQQWLGKYEQRGKWTRLPRGDAKLIRKKARAVLNKAKARLIDELFAKAIAQALDAYVADARASAAKRRHMERIEKQATRQRMDDAEQHRLQEERIERLMAEEAMNDSSSDSSSDDSSEGDWGLGATGTWGEGAHSPTRDGEWDMGVVEGWGAPITQPPTAHDTEEQDAFDSDTESTRIDIAARQKTREGQAPQFSSDASRVLGPEGGARRSTKLSLVGLRQKTRQMTGASIESEHAEIINLRCFSSNLAPGAEMFTRNLDFIPWPKTVVRVPPHANNPTSEFINASYMQGFGDEGARRYIVTQAPIVTDDRTPSDKADTLCAFWSMVWTQHARVIVNMQDGGAYWPESSNRAVKAGELKIALGKKQQKSGFLIQKLEISSLKDGPETTPRSVYHFTIDSWPDDGPHISTLTSMIEEIIHTKSKPTEPIIVHDRDGGSSAGVLVGIMNGMAMIKAVGEVDLAGIVGQLRADRAGMVQRPVEYVYMHKVLTMYSIQHLPAPPSYVDTPIFDATGSPPTGQIPTPVDPRRSTGVNLELAQV